MIVLENVTKTYLMGETTVNACGGVSLHIKQGEFVSLVGASGSGKSTLLHMIGLLDRPDTGILRISGHDTAQLPDDEISKLRSETIGFVFQQFHLLKRMTAFDNVELPLIYAKGDRPSANPTACWTGSAWAIAAITSRTSFPAASSSAWPSPAPWCVARLSCWPMNRPAISIPTAAPNHGLAPRITRGRADRRPRDA